MSNISCQLSIKSRKLEGIYHSIVVNNLFAQRAIIRKQVICKRNFFLCRHVTWKALQLSFFSFSFSSFLTLFLDRLAKNFCCCFIICYPASVWPGLDLFIRHTGQCFCQYSLYYKISCKWPGHAMCFRDKQ